MASTNQATSRRRVAPNFSLKSLPVDAKLTSREKAVLAAVLVGFHQQGNRARVRYQLADR